MGYQLATRAMLWSRVLTPRETLTLVAMALQARDDDTRPMYFGGSAALVLATIGRHHDPAGPTYATDKETVRRAVASLVRAGAVTRAREAVNGSRAVYELHVDALPLPGVDDRPPVDNVVSIATRRAPQGQRNVGPQTQQNVGPQGQQNVGPR